MRLPEVVLSERDAIFYTAKMQGYSYRQIAKANNVSPSTVHAGFIRHQKREAKLGAEATRDAVWTALNQYDSLAAVLWPLTKPRKVTIDGIEVEVAPSLEAIDRLLKVLAQKNKILGLERDVIQLTGPLSGGPALGSGEASIEATPEHMAKEFAAELIKHNVMSGPAAEMIEKMLATSDHPDVVDAEIVEDDEPLAITSGEEFIPQPWVDEDEDEYIPGAWVPDDMDDGDSNPPER